MVLDPSNLTSSINEHRDVLLILAPTAMTSDDQQVCLTPALRATTGGSLVAHQLTDVLLKTQPVAL